MVNKFQFSSIFPKCILSLPLGRFRGALLFLLLIIHSSLFINHCLAQFSPEQQKSIDSLNAIINNKNSHDTAKASAYVGLSEILYVSNLDTLIPLCQKSISLIDKLPKPIKNKKNVLRTRAAAFNNIGYSYHDKGKTKDAMDYYIKSLKIREEIGDKGGIAYSLNNIGTIYNQQGRIKEALDYFGRSLKLREELGDKYGIAMSFNNIATIYNRQGQNNAALDNYKMCIKIYDEINDLHGKAATLNNIGLIFSNQAQYNEALIYWKKSLAIREEIGDKNGIAGSLNNIAFAYNKLGDTEEAINNYMKSLNISEEIGFKNGIASSLINIGNIFNSQGKTQKALEYATKSLELFQEVGYPDKICSSSELLYQIYEKQGEGMKALEMHKLYIEMRDSINNMETQKAAIKNQMQYDFEKEQAATKAEQDKKDLLVKEEKEKQQIVLYATGGGLALVSVFLFLLFNRFKTTQRQKSIIEKQKHLVDEKQKEILDSIRYAKRIQDAILPSMSAMQQTLRNGFVLYKPKDVVAGDFYWMELGSGQVLPSGEDLGGAIFFAAADCTGHGVPGAMMSVVCSNALSKALLEEKAQTTGELLDKTRTLVIDRLAKSGDEVKDGMDISLCALVSSSDSTTGESYRELQWSGANNPLWIVRSSKDDAHSVAEVVTEPCRSTLEAPAANSPFEGGLRGMTSPSVISSGAVTEPSRSIERSSPSQYSLLEFRPDKQPIGMFADAKPFTTHRIELQKGDTIYIFTDGYQDQFGGDKSKKFKASKLKELILSIQHEPMDTQKEILNNEFENWKGSLEQVDDVCIIGVRI